MATTAERFTDAVYKAKAPNLGVWPPTTDVQLGYIGEFIGRSFVYRTRLDKLGINVPVAHEPATAQWLLAAKGSFNVAADAATSASAAGTGTVQARGRLRFNRSGAVLVQADQVTSSRIDDIQALERAVLESEWDKKHRVVTYISIAQRVRVLLSERRGAEVSFVASGSLLPEAEEIVSGKATIGLDLQSASGLEICETVEGPVTVVFRAMRLKRRGLSEVGRRGRLAPGPADEELVLAGWDAVGED